MSLDVASSWASWLERRNSTWVGKNESDLSLRQPFYEFTNTIVKKVNFYNNSESVHRKKY